MARTDALLTAHFRRMGPGNFLIEYVSGLAAEDLLASLAAVVDSLPPHRVETIALTPQGVAAVVNAGARDVLIDTVDDITERLAARGCETTPQLFAFAKLPYNQKSMVASFAAGIALLRDPALLADTVIGRRRSWAVNDEVTRRAAERAVAWCTGLQGTTWFEHGIYFSAPVDPQSVVGLLGVALRQRPGAAVAVTSEDGDFRRVSFRAQGHVTYEAPWREDWERTVDDLTDVLAENADIANYGLVKTSLAPISSWDSLLIYAHEYGQPEPEVQGGYEEKLRDEEGSFVPFPYGRQLLGEAHLQRAAHLESWSLQPIDGTSKTVLRARDQDQWFPHGPTAEVVERARAEFGPMLLTREVVAQARKLLRP